MSAEGRHWETLASAAQSPSLIGFNLTHFIASGASPRRDRRHSAGLAVIGALFVTCYRSGRGGNVNEWKGSSKVARKVVAAVS